MTYFGLYFSIVIFTAGADLKELLPNDSSREAIADSSSLLDISKPTIAVVTGFAIGGGFEFALMCDMMFAGESATFWLPEVCHGTITGWGGIHRLLASVGKSRTMEMVLSGSKMMAHEAAAAGLVNRVIPDDLVLNHAISVADSISRNSLATVKIAKKAVIAAASIQLQNLHIERQMFNQTYETEDRMEGINAFLEKRRAVFKNK